MLQEDVGVYVVDEVIEHIRLGMEVSTKTFSFFLKSEPKSSIHNFFILSVKCKEPRQK